MLSARLVAALLLVLAWSGPCRAGENDRARDDSVVEKTDKTAKEIAEKTGELAGKAAAKTEEGWKLFTAKTGELARSAADRFDEAAKKARPDAEDPRNKELLRKVEEALGKPLSAEQRSDFLEAAASAKAKMIAAREAFVARTEEATGLAKEKFNKILDEAGH